MGWINGVLIYYFHGSGGPAESRSRKKLLTNKVPPLHSASPRQSKELHHANSIALY